MNALSLLRLTRQKISHQHDSFAENSRKPPFSLGLQSFLELLLHKIGSRAGASAFCRPGRGSSIFAAAIHLARRRAERPSGSQPAARALYARGVFNLRATAVF